LLKNTGSLPARNRAAGFSFEKHRASGLMRIFTVLLFGNARLKNFSSKKRKLCPRLFTEKK
jgi:hypothetical protein